MLICLSSPFIWLVDVSFDTHGFKFPLFLDRDSATKKENNKLIKA